MSTVYIGLYALLLQSSCSFKAAQTFQWGTQWCYESSDDLNGTEPWLASSGTFIKPTVYCQNGCWKKWSNVKPEASDEHTLRMSLTMQLLSCN